MSIYERFPDKVAEFDSLLKTVEQLDDRTALVHAAKNLIRVAEAIVVNSPADADAHQMLGLAWYYFPGHSSWRSWHCRNSLQRALELEVDHRHALQYLGYLAFDQERYDEALALMKRIRLDDYQRPHHEWLALKIAELKLVCRLRLDPTTIPQQEFDEFTTWYRDALEREESDVTLGSTVPTAELESLAEWLFEQGDSPNQIPLRAILDFLKAIMPNVSFWNSDLESFIVEENSGSIENRRDRAVTDGRAERDATSDY